MRSISIFSLPPLCLADFQSRRRLKQLLRLRPRPSCGPQKFHSTVFSALQHCYILIALLDRLGFIFLNIADFKDVRAG